MKFELPAELKIFNVKDIWEEFREKLEKNSTDEECSIDAEKLEQFDAAGLQLLLAMHKNITLKGRGCDIVNLSGELEERMDKYGFRAIAK